MTALSSFRSQINTLVDLDSSYPANYATVRDRIQTGNDLPGIVNALTFGTGAGCGNLIYWERLSFPGGTTDLDLMALATTRPPAGGRLFSLIKQFIVRIPIPVAGQYLSIVGYGTNVWPGWLSGPDPAHKVADLLKKFNTVDGWPVLTSSHLLRINNPGSLIVADLILTGEGTIPDGGSTGGLDIGGDGLLAIS